MSQELLDRIAALEAENAKLKGEQVYVPQAYPAVRYHTSGAAKTIASADEEADGWSETPPAPDTTVYPSVRYHATFAPRLVESAEEAAALGEGWSATKG